jgi:hypothetical protein
VLCITNLANKIEKTIFDEVPFPYIIGIIGMHFLELGPADSKPISSHESRISDHLGYTEDSCEISLSFHIQHNLCQVGSCDHGNEPSGSIICWKVLE